MEARRHLIALTVALAAAAAGSSTATAGELVTIDVPSQGNVDVAQVRFNGPDHPKQLKANVLLPDGFDPAKRYPVLYLLHGAGEAYTTWVKKTKADVVTKGLDAIVVMPDAATGFYTNWYNGGRRGGPGWERYFLDELIPAVEARFPIRPGRRWHAVAGFSMGGFGSAYLAAQRPDYFGSSGPMSGFVAPRRAELPLVFDYATGQSYEAIYGPPDGAYAEGHDPVRLAPNLKHTRMFVITGNGVPDPAVPPPGPQSVVTGAAGEAELMLHSQDLADATRAAGADTTLTILPGIHDHPYWTDHLRRLLAWDPFKAVEESPGAWSYATVADRGRAWDLTYRFAAHPEAVATFERFGASLSGIGAGRVELCDAEGRGLAVDLPFTDRRLERTVSARILDGSRTAVRRAGRLRVELQATEPASVRLQGTVRRAGRTVPAGATTLDLAAGDRRTVTLRLPRAARTLLRRGSGRARVVARHGSCAGGRWATAARRLG